MNLIYKATNLINNKSYIGQTTTSLKQRKKEHETSSKLTYFHLAIKKYGKENFTWEILENNLTFDILNEREKYWIKFYKSNDKTFGYNLTEGGDNQDALNKWRQENPELALIKAKEGWLKMKQILVNNPEKEKIRKEKAKQGIQKYHKEHKKEIQERSYNIFLKNKDIALQNLQKANKERSKSVLCLETGIIYNSISEAGKLTNTSPSNISLCCHGKRKSAGKDKNGKKLHWQFIEIQS